MTTPTRIINAAAPIRICDNGRWTDTWFAERGQIFNIGVYPYAEVQIEVYALGDLPDRVVIYAENYGERYAPQLTLPGWDRHPLLEAAITIMDIPDDLAFQVGDGLDVLAGGVGVDDAGSESARQVSG